jgi:plasmid stability protein
MSKMIQVRNVPDPVHRKLKARAALAGLSLSDYILSELERVLEKPTREELLVRLASRTAVKLTPRPARVIAAERERR